MAARAAQFVEAAHQQHRRRDDLVAVQIEITKRGGGIGKQLAKWPIRAPGEPVRRLRDGRGREKTRQEPPRCRRRSRRRGRGLQERSTASLAPLRSGAGVLRNRDATRCPSTTSNPRSMYCACSWNPVLPGNAGLAQGLDVELDAIERGRAEVRQRVPTATAWRGRFPSRLRSPSTVAPPRRNRCGGRSRSC